MTLYKLGVKKKNDLWIHFFYAVRTTDKAYAERLAEISEDCLEAAGITDQEVVVVEEEQE